MNDRIGTWTKKSDTVTACNPFGQDHDHIDYEHDSEAEWEPEGEGEEIQSGDEEDEDVSADIMDPDDVSTFTTIQGSVMNAKYCLS